MFIKKENSFLKKNGRKLDSKRIEGVTLDSYYFTEYGIEFGHAVFNIFKKTQKGEKLIQDMKTNDLSLRGKGMVAVASFLGYSLDKVFNIFVGMKDSTEFVKITSADGHTIEVSPGMEILTKKGYVKACELKESVDEAMVVSGSSFSFKSGGESAVHLDMNAILDQISIKFGTNSKLEFSKLDGIEKKVAYMAGLKTDTDSNIDVSDLKSAKKLYSEKKKKVSSKKVKKDEKPGEEDSILETLFKTSAFSYKKITAVEKTTKSNIAIFNVNTLVAENLIVNNFIIRQNS